MLRVIKFCLSLKKRNNPSYILSTDKPIESENYKAELYSEFKKVVPLHTLLLRDENGYDLDTGLSYIKYK